jgi:hypothetical protein|tara:strand:- start:613 stop:927 length:315 start_codon:yes stop_codon:yes gene_type:complete
MVESPTPVNLHTSDFFNNRLAIVVLLNVGLDFAQAIAVVAFYPFAEWFVDTSDQFKFFVFDLTYTVRPFAFWASDKRIGFELNHVGIPRSGELYLIRYVVPCFL